MVLHARLILIVILFLTFSSNSTTITTYYIDSSNGNDLAAGTATTKPWKSISKVNSSTFRPGDVIAFKRGCTWLGQLNVTSAGTKCKPITFTAYGEGANPNIIAASTWLATSIKIWSKWIIVEHFFLRNGGEAGIYIAHGADHAIIRDNEITETGYGIASDADYCFITRNYIHDLKMIVSTVGGDDDYGSVGIWLGPVNGAGIVRFNEVSYNRLINCKANSLDYDTDGGAVEFYQQVEDCNIHHNYAEGCNGFFEVGGQQQTVTNNIVAFNIMLNCGTGGGFHTRTDYKYGVTVINFRFENNLIIDQNGGGILWFNGKSNRSQVLCKNNILYSPNCKEISNSSDFTHENNLYWIGLNSNQAFDLGFGEKIGNPMFVDIDAKNYHLSIGSPAIDAGVNLGHSIDYDGMKIPVNGIPDMGPFEYQK